MASYDIIGNIAIIKSENKTSKQKSEQAKQLLKQINIKTVIEKASNVRGRLRKIKTKHIAGKKNLITIYKENNCQFKLNVESCYFSPRLSNDRKQIAKQIKRSDKVLTMFSGIGPYPIVLYKLAKPKHITSIEISRECNIYQKENLKLNKIPKNRITLLPGDVKKQITKKLGTFDIIMMARPNLKDTFLEQALLVSKKNTKIFYHGFCNKDNLKELKEQLINEAKTLKRKIKITNTEKAGDIAPYKFRYRIKIKVLN
mgnify:CR=1 FL=1|jgi:tRNA (guanine37-N1)-methyltransferase